MVPLVEKINDYLKAIGIKNLQYCSKKVSKTLYSADPLSAFLLIIISHLDPIQAAFVAMEELEKLNPDVFSRRDLRWLDFSVGTGMLVAAAYDRLMDGLALQYPDETERKRHICAKMLHVQDRTRICLHLVKNSLPIGDDLIEEFGDIGPEQHRDLLGTAYPTPFDVVISFPPHSKGGVEIISHKYASLLVHNEGILAKAGCAALVMTKKWTLQMSTATLGMDEAENAAKVSKVLHLKINALNSSIFFDIFASFLLFPHDRWRRLEKCSKLVLKLLD
jgi:hypothetical protein